MLSHNKNHIVNRFLRALVLTLLCVASLGSAKVAAAKDWTFAWSGADSIQLTVGAAGMSGTFTKVATDDKYVTFKSTLDFSKVGCPSQRGFLIYVNKSDYNDKTSGMKIQQANYASPGNKTCDYLDSMRNDLNKKATVVSGKPGTTSTPTGGGTGDGTGGGSGDCEEGPGLLHSLNEEACAQAKLDAQNGGPNAVNAQCNADKSDEDQCKLVGKCQDAGDLSVDCSIVSDIKVIVNLLSALVGIVIVIMITVGGVQYSAARDNPQAVAAARGRITNALIALVTYLLLYGALQYLIPGGLL